MKHPKGSQVELNLQSIEPSKIPDGARVCLDFGTAMSKATLIREGRDAADAEISVLRLGVPARQEHISQVMLVSSVYVDEGGLIWFGQSAVDKSSLESEDGSRQRLDNIKRRLSEDGWEDEVAAEYNPTDVAVTYGEMVLAYLAFMTWTVNRCIDGFGLGVIPRRFALPSLGGKKRREVVERLAEAVGEAQVLADTFGDVLHDGLPMQSFLDAVHEIRAGPRKYPFVQEDVTEPVGVAGSVISWTSQVDMLFMVVDIGAGTSDFGLFRIYFDPTSDRRIALEAEGSSRALTEAGNHLDNLLIAYILDRGGLRVDHPRIKNILGKLNLGIREFKETLFNEGSVFVPLDGDLDVEVDLDDFIELGPVQQFAASLRNTMIDILESVDESWVNWVRVDPKRRLVVMLTGGGSRLPMVQDLARDPLRVHGSMLQVAKASDVPSWLDEFGIDLREEYSRVAVSLGGARQSLMNWRVAKITAGDVVGPPVIGGYYQKGQ